MFFVWKYFKFDVVEQKIEKNFFVFNKIAFE